MQVPRVEATLLTASPRGGDSGSRSGRAGGHHWPTHLMCRPSCCTPRAGSSDTPSTPAWWAPRRHTPPGPRRGICGRERRDQVLTTWRTAHSPPGPVVSAPLSTVAFQNIQPKTFLAGTALSPYSVHHGPSHPADAPVSWAHSPSASAPTSSQVSSLVPEQQSLGTPLCPPCLPQQPACSRGHHITASQGPVSVCPQQPQMVSSWTAGSPMAQRSTGRAQQRGAELNYLAG